MLSTCFQAVTIRAFCFLSYCIWPLCFRCYDASRFHRAVYAKTDIYLLDDPLAAADAAVRVHLLEHCIRGLLRDKRVILVTQRQNLAQTDKVIVLKNEKIVAQGFLGDLVNIGDEDWKSKGLSLDDSSYQWQQHSVSVGGKTM